MVNLRVFTSGYSGRIALGSHSPSSGSTVFDTIPSSLQISTTAENRGLRSLLHKSLSGKRWCRKPRFRSCNLVVGVGWRVSWILYAWRFEPFIWRSACLTNCAQEIYSYQGDWSKQRVTSGSYGSEPCIGRDIHQPWHPMAVQPFHCPTHGRSVGMPSTNCEDFIVNIIDLQNAGRRNSRSS